MEKLQRLIDEMYFHVEGDGKAFHEMGDQIRKILYAIQTIVNLYGISFKFTLKDANWKKEKFFIHTMNEDRGIVFKADEVWIVYDKLKDIPSVDLLYLMPHIEDLIHEVDDLVDKKIKQLKKTFKFVKNTHISSGE